MLTEYLQPFLAFAISRTDNADEAEELSQEIVYQAVSATARSKEICNYNAFVWSIAHNTYKRWLARRKRSGISYGEFAETFGNILKDTSTIEEHVENLEDINLLHRELSLLTRYYRTALVHYYYDGLDCGQVSSKLGISVDMVKFYLFKGRQKLREGIQMPREYGEKSFNPSKFYIYKSGWSTINIWPLFERKLPGNIVLATYDNPMDVGELSIETGVPTVFLEDEIKILVQSGLIKETNKSKYQTNFFIAKKELIDQIQAQIDRVIQQCVDGVEESFQIALPTIKSLGLFKHDVPDIRYKWLFLQLQEVFNIQFSENYPQILSDGSSNFIWGEEADAPVWSGGRTPYSGEGFTLDAIDYSILGYKHQNYLRHKGVLLTELALGRPDPSKKEEYAQLIKDGYAVKSGDAIYPNIPVISSENWARLRSIIQLSIEPVRASAITDKLISSLEQAIKPKMTKLIQGTAVEYASLMLSVHIESALMDGMQRKGYITLPEENDNTPMTSYLLLK